MINTNEWHIIVVEDEFDSAQMVSKILRHSGIRVDVVSDGRECMQMLGNVRPTLVVMDLAMPTMDGWHTLMQMRTNPRTADIPVVAITAYHSSDVEDDAAEAGFDAYFPKPVDPHSFVNDLRNVVERHHSEE